MEGLAAEAGGTASFGQVAVKVNAVEVLRRELSPKRKTAAPRWSGFVVLGGGVGDSYQPVEEGYRLARGALELFEELGVPVHVLTKSTLVLRDVDILERMAGARRSGALVSFSISTVDDAIASVFEPGAPPPSQRLAALSALAKRGIPGGVFLMPVIPDVTDSREAMSSSIAAAANAGARYVIFGGMTLKDGRQKDHFLTVLSAAKLELIPYYRSLYPGDPWGEASGDYYSRINRLFGELALEQRVPPRIPRALFEGILHGADLVIALLEQIHAMLELEGKSSSSRHAAFQLSGSKDGDIPASISPAARQAIDEILRTGTARLHEQLLSRATMQSCGRWGLLVHSEVMTKRKRVLAAIEGRVGDIDRPPASVWYHFGTQFLDGRKHGELEAAYFRHYDFDFLKMMNDYPWPLPVGLRAVESPDDLARTGPLSLEEPSFREQLAALRTASALVGADTFVIDTIFNPWGIARRTLRRRAGAFLKEQPQKMLDWLASCTESLKAYIAAAAKTGIGGIFFSVNGAEAEGLSDEEFDRFVRPFDLAALEAARSVGPLLIGHIHGKRLRMDRVIDYPVPVLSWSHLHDNETFTDVRRRTGRCLLGGMDEIGTSQLTARDIVESVLAAAREARGGGFIAGPGCAVPADIPPDLIRAPREAVEMLRS